VAGSDAAGLPVKLGCLPIDLGPLAKLLDHRGG
jgi:hypothetical protein